MTKAKDTTIDGLREVLRRGTESLRLEHLDNDRLAVLAVVREGDNRWGTLFLLLMMVKELLEPVRFMLLYPNSWAYKAANFSLPGWVLPLWLFICAAIMVPLILLFIFHPRAVTRRRAIGMAATGLGASAFAFAYMALIVSRFDAPQAVDQYTWGAVASATVMLLLTGTVNNSQRSLELHLCD